MMKGKWLLILLFALFLAPQAWAQGGSASSSKTYTVKVTPKLPDPTCNLTAGSYTVDLGNVNIPWSGQPDAVKTAYVPVTVQFTSTKTVTVSINNTGGSGGLSRDNGKVLLWAGVNTSTTPPSWNPPPSSANKSVSLSGSQQSTTFYLHGRAVVKAGATAGSIQSFSGTLTAICTN